MKTTTYNYSRICQCRNCEGRGTVNHPLTGEPRTCPMCEGSGKVKKVNSGTVTVEPYKEDNSK